MTESKESASSIGWGERLRKIYLDSLEGRVPETIWFGKESGTTRDAAQEMKELFDGVTPFDTPKPTQLVKRILQLTASSKDEDIILDFFSGSATTAQAALELNREDGGTRRFILVQLPEPTGNKKFPTIAEIGKERIRRVIAQMNAGTGNLTRTDPEDLGFKVYKLAESHFNLWAGVPERTPATYQRQLRLIAEEPLVPLVVTPSRFPRAS